jgi:hypothetical protein
MSSVIKFSTLTDSSMIGAFKGHKNPERGESLETSFLGPIIPPEQRELEVARVELEDIRHELTGLKSQMERAVEAAYAKGVVDARATLVKSESRAIETLEANIQIALNLYKQKLKELEQASLFAAQSALEHLFSDTEQIRAAVKRNILAQIRKFGENMVVGVIVSEVDFAGPDANTSILSLNHNEAIQILVSKTLGQGEFEIEMRLGHLEFSLARNLGEIKSLFESISDEGDIVS